MLRKLGHRLGGAPDYDGQEVPAGQFVTEKFPILTFGGTPQIDLATWRFRLWGQVEEEVSLGWDQFMGLKKSTVKAPFHCVTQWSRMKNTWEGVAFSEVAELARPRPDARFALVHCYGGYSTNLPMDILLGDDELFAYAHDGEPLSAEHGGPLRLVVPKRYGWKSAKWTNGIEFMANDAPGFWEARGYHNDGDPLKEQRFWDELG